MDKLSHYSKSLYLETLTYQILVHKTTKQEQRCYLKGLGKLTFTIKLRNNVEFSKEIKRNNLEFC